MRFNIGKINGAYWLKNNGDYIAAGGRDLLIFHKNGQLVMYCKDFHQVQAMAFLPDEKLLVGDAKRYAVISLKTGTPVWSFPRPKREYSYSHFAVSPTYEYAYGIDMKRDTPFIIRINLVNGNTSAYRIKKFLRATSDFMCDADGNLCFLQCQYNEYNESVIGETCVLCADLRENRTFPHYSVIHETVFDGARLGHSFLGSTETILTNDLHVYSFLDETAFFAAEHSLDLQLPKKAPAFCFLDASGRFLQMTCLDEMRTVFIDLQKRKAVAQYGITERLPGCLIANEFWLCENNSLVRKPFPVWETLPKRKLSPMF